MFSREEEETTIDVRIQHVYYMSSQKKFFSYNYTVMLRVVIHVCVVILASTVYMMLIHCACMFL